MRRDRPLSGGLNEVSYQAMVDPRYFRPTEVETLLGDPAKAKAKLGWEPTTPFEELVREMVEADYSSAKRDTSLGGCPRARSRLLSARSGRR